MVEAISDIWYNLSANLRKELDNDGREEVCFSKQDSIIHRMYREIL